MSSSISDDILSSILNTICHENTLLLFDLMLVSKDWHSLLSNTAGFWRNVKIIGNSIEDDHVPAVVKRAADLSNNSLESFIFSDPYSRTNLDTEEILSTLELSKTTIKRIEFPFHLLDHHIPFFKTFTNLERLNTLREDVPEVQVSTPGKLVSLAAMISDSWEISKHDLEWFSHLQSIHWCDVADDSCLPTNLARIFQVCKGTLTEVEIYAGCEDEVSEDLDSYHLPNVKSFRLNFCSGEPPSYGVMKLPNLVELWASPELDFVRKFKNLEILRLQIWYSDYLEEDIKEDIKEKQVKMILAVQQQEASLKELQLNCNGDPSSFPPYSVDHLLQYLKVKSAKEVKCPNLSILKFSQWQVYDPKLLAEVLMSRRLTANLGQTGRVSPCSAITLYLARRQIPAFLRAEQEVLAALSEGMRKSVGKAELIEGTEEWYDF